MALCVESAADSSYHHVACLHVGSCASQLETTEVCPARECTLSLLLQRVQGLSAW